MRIFVNGRWVVMAPAGDEGAEDGGANGAPAGEDAGSEGESEFEDMAESFESGSYDEVEEGEAEDESESDAESDDSQQDETDESSEETEEDEDADAEADEDGTDKDDDEEDADDEEEDEGEKPEPLTAEQIETARNEYIDSIAEKFAITDEEADQLRTEPEKVLPRLLAKTHTQALEQAVAIMRQNLPQLVGSQLTQQSTAKEVEGKFFGKYPELKSKKAMRTAEKMAKAYRSANPDADLDEVMDNVAFMTWKKLGLPMDKLSERMNGTQSEEINRSSQERRSKESFRPASPGKTGAENRRPASGEAESEFEEIANLMDNDSYFDET